MLSISLKKVFTAIAILALIAIGARFLIRDAFQYFVFTESTYTAYFWPRRVPVFIHILFGMTAFILGPFQFISRIRKNYVKTHRTIGKIYLCAIAVSAPASIYMSLTSQINFVYASGLFMLAIAWITTSLIAYISIRKGLTTIHREWMVRSYVVTFAFGTFRVFSELLEGWGVGPPELRFAVMAWSCWSVPLFATEVILQVKKFNKLRLAIGKKSTAPIAEITEN
jgi:uncharacterized membrane protein